MDFKINNHTGILLLVFFLLVSCGKQNDILIPTKQEFVATLPSSLTKSTVTSDGKVSWESTDAIGIFDENIAAPVKATIKSISSDGKTAVFTPANEITKAVGAIYPYDSDATIADNSTISISLGTTRSGNFADANVAASKADGYKLAFKNVTAVFKFNVSDDKAKSVKITAPKVTGTLGITLGTTITASLDKETATDEITVSNISANTDYYVAIAPSQYNDISFSWFDNSGAQLGSATLGKAFTATVNSMYTWNDLKAHEDIVVFSDENFKAYCVANFDTDKDGEISKTEALKVTEINVNTEEVASLEGIAAFENLASLTCKPIHTNYITTYGLKHILYLDEERTQEVTSLLTSLDVSKNLNLEELDCPYNKLTSLDLSHNTKLVSLSCGSSQGTGIETLTLPDTETLINIDCSSNNLSSIDLSKNTALKSLDCKGNKLSSIDISNNPALEKLYCSGNSITELDVTTHTNLVELWCGETNISTLDVTKNVALKELNICLLSGVDISKNVNLEILSCVGCSLKSLDLSIYPNLVDLYCGGNQLTSLDLSHNSQLTRLYCSGNELKSLDLSSNPDLWLCYCDENPLTSLTTKGADKLAILDCNSTSLADADISTNTKLEWANFSNSPDLKTIYVWKGFDKADSFVKDDSAVYVEVGNSVGNIEDYNIIDPWAKE